MSEVPDTVGSGNGAEINLDCFNVQRFCNSEITFY